MTTASSPLAALQAQADTCAKQLKRIARGEIVDPKLAAAKRGGELVFGVAMDDKLLKITIPWSLLESSDEASLAAFIVKHMQEKANQ